MLLEFQLSSPLLIFYWKHYTSWSSL